MASSSGDENNQNTAESATKLAAVTILPRQHTSDSYLEEFMSQRSYDVSDTDDPKGAAEIGELPVRKKSRSSAKDTVWGWLTHEYILELARTNKQ
ncbi:hypothetical protein MKX03_017440, partial [Papaver bracteatum]